MTTRPSDSWRDPPGVLRIAPGEVHVWKARLDVSEARLRQYAKTLSEDEWSRVSRLLHEHDRRRFIVSRGLLRTLLGRYLGLPPGSIQFRYGRHGKPAMSFERREDDLRFNASHSGGMALYGVAIGREVGVDVERVRDDFVPDEIIDRFFSPRDRTALRLLGPENRLDAFYRYWTRKEAYLKARGEGLAFLEHFDVSVSPHDPSVLSPTCDEPAEASKWFLRDLRVSPGYVGAIAVEGRDAQSPRSHPRAPAYSNDLRERRL